MAPNGVPLMGLLNQVGAWEQGSPVWQGLLGLAQSLGRAGGPSPYPVNFGSALAEGMGAFNQGMQQGQEQQWQHADRELKRRQYEAEIRRRENLDNLLGGQTPTLPNAPGALARPPGLRAQPNAAGALTSPPGLRIPQTASTSDVPPASGGIFADVPADVMAMARAVGGEDGLRIVADWKASQGDAPKTVGGMYYDPAQQRFVPIPGYTEQAAAIAAAGRPPQQPQQPSPFGSWYAAFKAENQRPPNAKEIARWNNENSGGGITPAQTANNAEIDAARSYVEQSGLSREEILRRTQSADNLGLENPEYDPYLAQAVKLGFQRKIGDDPQFDSFQQRYRGGGQPTDNAGSGGADLYGAGSSQDNPVMVTTPEEAAQLPPGTYFKTPDGSLRRTRAR
jgi:hypothetical protein